MPGNPQRISCVETLQRRSGCATIEHAEQITSEAGYVELGPRDARISDMASQPRILTELRARAISGYRASFSRWRADWRAPIRGTENRSAASRPGP